MFLFPAQLSCVGDAIALEHARKEDVTCGITAFLVDEILSLDGSLPRCGELE